MPRPSNQQWYVCGRSVAAGLTSVATAPGAEVAPGATTACPKLGVDVWARKKTYWPRQLAFADGSTAAAGAARAAAAARATPPVTMRRI
jgi:hypothetical protein